MIRSAAVLILTLTLVACNQPAEKKAGAGTAGGEILPGSISDAMLPLDQVKSQAPLAPKTESSGKPKAATSSAEPKAVAYAPAADPAPTAEAATAEE